MRGLHVCFLVFFLVGMHVKDGAAFETRHEFCLRNVTICHPNGRECKCSCTVVETCENNIPPPYTNLTVCMDEVRRLCKDRCGKLYFGCRKASDRECRCSWVKGCANEQEFDTVAKCETQLTLYRVAKRKCPQPALSQYPANHYCSSRKLNFCEYGSDCDLGRCCYANRGCNPNPFKYTTSESCHLPLPNEYVEDPCKAVTCRPGFVCTQDASSCRPGWCSPFKATDKVDKLFCVLDPAYDPCSNHTCAPGWKCRNSVTQSCALRPCALVPVCKIDVGFNPCKLNSCNPGEKCKPINGTLCRNGVCLRRAACMPDPKAGPPRFLRNIEEYYEVFAGDELMISCQVYGNPPIENLTWISSGHEVKNQIRNHSSERNSSTQLIIQNATVEDMGIYTCFVENFIGRKQINVQLVVHKNCPPCEYENLVKSLCSMDITALVIATGVLNQKVRERYWTHYELNVTRLFHNSASTDLQIAEGQVITVKAKVPPCNCQAVRQGRRYIIGANFDPATSDLSLFPEGVIQQWNVARSSMRNAVNSWNHACSRHEKAD